MEDVTKDADEGDAVKCSDWTLEAKACGTHLKDDQLNISPCESCQVSLISRPKAKQVEFEEDDLLEFSIPEDSEDVVIYKQADLMWKRNVSWLVCSPVISLRAFLMSAPVPSLVLPFWRATLPTLSMAARILSW